MKIPMPISFWFITTGLVCQVLKGLAYPVNGALMGGLDWSFAAATMWAAQAACVCAVAAWGGGAPLSLRRLWGALVLLFLTQVLVGIGRILSGRGPWEVLYARGGEGANSTQVVDRDCVWQQEEL